MESVAPSNKTPSFFHCIVGAGILLALALNVAVAPQFKRVETTGCVVNTGLDGCTVNSTVAVPNPPSLLALNFTTATPGSLGVPEISPVVAFKIRPAGKVTSVENAVAALAAAS